MKKVYMAVLGLMAGFSGYSQTAPVATQALAPEPVAPAPVKDWNFNFYGYVKTDFIYDTRKMACAREYLVDFYPLDVVLDKNGNDINAVHQSNYLSVNTRTGIKIGGPEVWGAKTLAVIETDFYGNIEGASIGMLRLRHAYANFDWGQTAVTVGQTWYPQYVPEVAPEVAAFNGGLPFNPFGWATQFKIKQMLSDALSFSFIAYKEREFAAPGPGAANAATINSALPSLHGQFQYRTKNVILGAGAEYKSLQPLTVSNNQKTSEKINSTSFLAYGKYMNDKISVKAYGITGGNMYNFVTIGGYSGRTIDNGIETYTASKTSAAWMEISKVDKRIAPGLFIGYVKNNGGSFDATTADPTKITYANYIRGINSGATNSTRVVDDIWRVSGRVDLKHKKFRVTPELEYTAATWGDLSKSTAAATTNLTDVANMRFLLSCVYNF